ncbi:GTP cyclohydrolase II [Roseovarius pacificus]|nr:GTP cyclohydrolase II [Roseovarius pacificus]
MGVPIVLTNRNSHILVVAVETLTPARLAAFRALGDPDLIVSARRAKALASNIDLSKCPETIAQFKVPNGADCKWLLSKADPVSVYDGRPEKTLRPLHSDQAELLRGTLSLLKSAMLLPAALLLSLRNADKLSAIHGLTQLDLNAVCSEFSRLPTPVHTVAAQLPLVRAGFGRMHVFRPVNCDQEHYAVEFGTFDRDVTVLVRMHSACFTGDVLGSLKCDCGPQLRAAVEQLGQTEAGILLYLNQEGRGIGLANKLRAYALQDRGLDTVEANHHLGFEDDERDFRIGAAILKQMGIPRVRLLTNNPSKLAALKCCGIIVTERVPLQVGRSNENAAYLRTKATKSGHLL